MDHPPSSDYDATQADIMARLHAIRAQRGTVKRATQPLPDDGGAGRDLRHLATYVLALALLLALGQALLTVWARSADRVAMVDSSGGRVP